MTTPEVAAPLRPVIDAQQPTHLRTATFALG